MRALFPTTILASALLFSAAALAEDAKPAKDYTIIEYNGETLKFSEVVDTWKTVFPGGNAPDFATFDEDIRQNVLRGLISEKLLYKEAVTAGFDKSDEVKKRLAEIEKQVVLQAYMESKAGKMVTDAELKKAYDAHIAQAAKEEELKARHILVATEEEAKKVSERLKQGDSFEALAKELSTDKASGEQGGDLGWFTKDKMVPEFADAAYAMKKGGVSAPVKSGFGWHIIKLEDRRAIKPATFDEMKAELRSELSENAVDRYVRGLISQATIKYYDASGKELPFSKEEKPEAAPAAKAP